MKFKGLRDSFSPVSKNTGSEFLFAGENALNADINALTEAERMSLYEDAKNLDTWKQTGWFKGVDGKWRYELPNGKLKDDIKWLELGPDDNTFLSAKLPDVYDNPTFFEAYPEAKDVSVYVHNLDNGTAGAYNELGEEIDLDKSFNYLKTDLEKMKLLEELRQDPLYIKAHNYDKPPADIRKDYLEYKNSDLYKKEDELLAKLSTEGWNDKALNTLQHEIQHYIQSKENFARGGDVQAGYDRYKKLAGEVEARAVEARSGLTPEQMKEYAPFLKSNYGYDVAPTKQILKSVYGDYGNGKVYSTKKNSLYEKLIKMSKDLKSPKPVEKSLKKEGEIVIMEGSNPFSEGEINYAITEITSNMSPDEKAKGYAVRKLGNEYTHLKYDKNGKHKMGKFDVNERLYDENR
jgi:ribosomal protein S17